MKKGIIALCALSVMATLPVAVMSMNIKSGDDICVKVSGDDEEKALCALEAFIKSNL